MILQQYTKKGLLLFLLIMPLHTLLLNFLMFGSLLLLSGRFFAVTYFITFLVVSLLWLVHDRVSIILKERLPREADYMKQFWLKIVFFILIKLLTLHFLFIGYEAFFNLQLPQSNYVILLVIANIINVFTTILHEGAVGFDKWKEAITETEKLKHAYMQSQLWNLKSQLNPHFLFNNLNTLSSLIEENGPAAETYLDEMSKVYRYLLRYNEETLVPLADELRFLRSYFHILSARYGAALQVLMNFHGAEQDLMIPPLSLQALLESTLAEAELSKTAPLLFDVRLKDNCLQVQNSMQKKAAGATSDEAAKLKTLIRKFELLTRRPVLVKEDEQTRTILLPLAQRA